eukprot:Gregarina_sp_Poly_1__78@NODE_1018_length_5347_cov_44_838447_g688_i1_p5_GENE_NODE_1018_length_5347_cov_44_838447_g688_i1NODE_1018_length_5347_cov_44_838447_g688_i1_p5_ORF_typecomplete_len125_score3_55ALMT/PF11744_8/0_0035_NODE_1018_length_5347_cov_44_838447_g688_i119972371
MESNTIRHFCHDGQWLCQMQRSKRDCSRDCRLQMQRTKLSRLVSKSRDGECANRAKWPPPHYTRFLLHNLEALQVSWLIPGMSAMARALKHYKPREIQKRSSIERECHALHSANGLIQDDPTTI